MRYIFFIFFFPQLLIHEACFSQNSFSIGAKGGMGITVPGVHSSFANSSNTYNIRNNAFYCGGILGQYLLGDLFGLESGILISYQTFHQRGIITNPVKNYFGWNSLIGINDYQIPIQLIYKISHPGNPYKHFKIGAGASLDWLSTEYLKKSHNSLFTSTILLGIRIGNEKGKLGRIEYGLEYQYSAWGRYKFSIDNNQGNELLNSRYSILSFNIYYYILNKDL